MVSYSEATAEIYGFLQTNFNAIMADMFGYEGEIRWPSQDYTNSPNSNKPYIEPEKYSVNDTIASFTDTNAKMFNCTGVLYIALYCPLTVENSRSKGEQLASRLKRAFMGARTAGGVFFRDTRIGDNTGNKLTSIFNIYIDYEYSELR
jgi:hypothetical protein